MELQSSKVHQKLDAKMKIGGVETTDLLLVLIVAAILNFLFGSLSMGPIIVVCIPGSLFVVLYFGKKGKPDDFLKDAIRYHFSAGALLAGTSKEDK